MTNGRARCLAESLNDALGHLMDTDDSVVLIGQDIGRLGGVFRVTRGLQERFGSASQVIFTASLGCSEPISGSSMKARTRTR